MTNIGRLAIIFVLVLFVAACQPRGETKSVDEVLSYEQQRFETLPVDAEDESRLNSLRSSLKDILSDWNTPHLIKDINLVSKDLSDISSSISFPMKPALDEIIREYKSLGEMPSDVDFSQETGRIKLLVARTYGLLADEIASRNFK